MRYEVTKLPEQISEIVACSFNVVNTASPATGTCSHGLPISLLSGKYPRSSQQRPVDLCVTVKAPFDWIATVKNSFSIACGPVTMVESAAAAVALCPAA